ncbi:MAG: PepSY domain-containing protein [Clostridia bacterium]|nr:PepSY domain-containing protein [Clostridia bacterium]
MKKRVPLWIVIILAFTCLAVGAVAMRIADNSMQNAPMGGTPSVNDANQISEQEAKNIALKKAGLTEQDVIFDRTEKDYENGILVYEIEFRKGKTEYKAEISVSDGKIISWEVDND